MRGQQSGVMLLEALIAILIFSFGVLGIIGLQTTAQSVTRDGSYRADAALLANELVGRMFAFPDRSGASLQANFQGSAGFVSSKDKDDPDRCRTDNPATDGPEFCLWFNNRVMETLPGAVVSGQTPAQVIVTPGAAGSATNVQITVRWQVPGIEVRRRYDVVVSVI